MKHLLLLLLGLSSLPLLAQRSAVFEKSKCSLYLYNQDSTSLELMKASFKARKVETIVVEFQCHDEEVENILDGAPLYLVLVNAWGGIVLGGGPIITIGGTEIQTYTKAIYRSKKGIRFEVNPEEDFRWKKGESYLFCIYSGEEVLRRKVILFN
ncbi:MAG: hypothetical protein AAF927_18875 [Bacteroidota bacterium]